jgi:hypothetical protein
MSITQQLAASPGFSGGANPMQVMALQSAAANRASRFNMAMQSEQWEWQKKMYEEQQKALSEFGGLGGLIGQYNQSAAEARAANEARYAEMVGIADAAPDQRSADIRSDYEGREQAMLSKLAGLGMSGTTIGDTLGAGIEREKQAAVDRSTQAHAAQRIGVRERRTDQYPNQQVLLSLIQSLGQGGGPAGIRAMSQALGGMQGIGSGQMTA